VLFAAPYAAVITTSQRARRFGQIQGVPAETRPRPAWLIARRRHPAVPQPEQLAGEPAGSVQLLPASTTTSFRRARDRDAVLPAAERARVHRPQGRLSPVLLIDGQMAGV
jgi:hypothetical protein